MNVTNFVKSIKLVGETLAEKDLKQAQKPDFRVNYELGVSLANICPDNVLSYKVDFENELTAITFKISVVENMLKTKLELSEEDFKTAKAKIFSESLLREYNYFLKDFVKMHKDLLL